MNSYFDQKSYSRTVSRQQKKVTRSALVNIEISVVRQIAIPLSEFPHIPAESPICDAIGMLLDNCSADGRHMHFDDLLVIDNTGRLVGQLQLSTILENFFRTALRPTASRFFFEDNDYFADMILIIDEWFRKECKRQSDVTVHSYMLPHPLTVEPAAHVVQALGLMLNNERNLLPVTEDNVLKGAVRMEDIFRVLGSCISPSNT